MVSALFYALCRWHYKLPEFMWAGCWISQSHILVNHGYPTMWTGLKQIVSRVFLLSWPVHSSQLEGDWFVVAILPLYRRILGRPKRSPRGLLQLPREMQEHRASQSHVGKRHWGPGEILRFLSQGKGRKGRFSGSMGNLRKRFWRTSRRSFTAKVKIFCTIFALGCQDFSWSTVELRICKAQVRRQQTSY